MNQKLIIPVIGLCIFLGYSTAHAQPPGITQFVETRKGQEIVWGVNIQLDRLSFIEKIMPNQIRIVDHKYNRDLKGIMTWSLSDDRKTLHIRFRPGWA